ncbi:CDP-diacylglycerol--serine O-phosphatidyltransferase [bacterium]|nr:CDP-diacylglycerol--serine O-phosphatidyltransferase [bacterium]
MANKRFKKFVPVVPGIFTIGNMFAGFVSILHSTSGRVVSGAWLIIIGGIFDLLDGKVARLTRGTTEFGVQLDSFADFLTFGVAPGILLFSLGIYNFKNWGFLIPVIFLIAGAFRLARYNVTASPHKKTDFQGLPIPLAAIFVASFIIFTDNIWGSIKFTAFFTPMMILLAWLMISNVRYPANPFIFSIKGFNWKVFVLAAILVAILVKPRWFIFPTIAIYILNGFVREIYWIVRRTDKEVDNNEITC